MAAVMEWAATLSPAEFLLANTVLSVISVIPGLAGAMASMAGVLFGILGGTLLCVRCILAFNPTQKK